ncbi:MAG: hypothetical protein A2Z29_11535 [Chloroflexi bacterium RBG_16_56_11]|nr:MAG: hypothetical protein A2Z29_11535 [Chloroflexi bacterium RBG_16_56_11]
MNIEIAIPPFLQPLTGNVKQLSVSGGTVSACLDDLVKRYPGLKERLFGRDGQLPKGINVFINGKNVYPDGLSGPVHVGDKIHISYVVLGG